MTRILERKNIMEGLNIVKESQMIPYNEDRDLGASILKIVNDEVILTIEEDENAIKVPLRCTYKGRRIYSEHDVKSFDHEENIKNDFGKTDKGTMVFKYKTFMIIDDMYIFGTFGTFGYDTYNVSGFRKGMFGKDVQVCSKFKVIKNK